MVLVMFPMVRSMDAYTASNMDIRSVDPAALVDIRDVKVNTALPKRERILD